MRVQLGVKCVKQIPEVKVLLVSVVVFVVRFEVVVEFVLVEDMVAAVKAAELDIVLLVLIRYLSLII